jgi:hypothetical protein
MKEHKFHTKTFEELSYAEQEKSITATINNLSNAIRAHVRRAFTKAEKSPNEVLLKCIGQCSRMVARLTK